MRYKLNFEPLIQDEPSPETRQLCPICNSPEESSYSPRTTYKCGSSDYDQRLNTFKQSLKCKKLSKNCNKKKYIEFINADSHYRLTIFNLHFIPQIKKHNIHVFRGFLIIPTISFEITHFSIVVAFHWLYRTIELDIFRKRGKTF